MMLGIISLIVGVTISMMAPSKYKGYPILSVAIVYFRRTSKLKWLAWQLPLLGNNAWYFDIVEREVFKS